MTKNIIDETIKFAEQLQIKIQNNISYKEQQFHKKMKLLLNNPTNKVLLIELLDRSFRSKNNNVKFEAISHTLNKYGMADFFNPFEKFLLFMFLNLGGIATNISVPFFISNIRKDTSSMVLDSNPSFLSLHNKKREQENITINVNLIGEEVLGEVEAKNRIEHYRKALKSNYITYISIKITTIFSQIQILDFDYSKREIVNRLDSLYALAKEESKRQNKSKFINLDMEEFRDLELTVASFMESIDKFDIEAGIVLQAYLPDSYDYLKKLINFSKTRVNNGKKPIKVRIVKGANMEAEETIASQRDWPLPTFSRKVDTDSNYNKMLHLVLENDNYKYINIGIASHNLFEIAYAYTLINHKNALESFTFEMLEGMSVQASKELSSIHKLILYAPVCDMEHFNNAIAYLVRRLDENTAEQNFMRHFFGLKLNDDAWNAQKAIFLESLEGINKISNETKRTQDRNKKQSIKTKIDAFHNEADTDFILSKNREWAKHIRDKYQNLPTQDIYAQSTKKLETTNKLEIRNKIDNRLIANIHLANEAGIKEALDIAKKSSFSSMGFEKIHSILSDAANNIREKRGDLIGVAALEVGKTYIEIDAEISEAIDFLEFYPYSLRKLKNSNPQTEFKPKGIGVVIAPWNFPIGISAGSISAALSSGNRVIYKPSSISSFTGYKLCECFWDAGIPKDALIYLPAKGSDISKYLINSNDVSFAILTGGEDTAHKMLESNPTLLLSAETGGKNATIVTKHADRDQAVKNIVHSAFSNSGQKCSATSLLILEEEVYNDDNFKAMLKDATESLNVGDPFDFKNKLGTLSDKPDSKLEYALNNIETHEEWLIKPKFKDNNPYIMYPSIKYGTKVGDYSYKTELFAPLLSVIKAKDLDDAINIANSTSYGLTGALESLDEREWEIYKERIEVGNAYINKPSTGAIVLRQPFGGVKKSAIGFGRKVGVFNYITQFMHINQDKEDKNQISHRFLNVIEDLLKNKKLDNNNKQHLNNVIKNIKSYSFHYENEFIKTHEYTKVRGEDNLFLYTKIKNMLFRISENDNLDSIISVIAASNIVNINLEISIDKNLYNQYFVDVNKEILENIIKETNVALHIEDIDSCINKISSFERVRYHGNVDINDMLYIVCAKNAKVIIREKPIINGRFELLYYFNEKSISVSYHRYGNLGSRAIDNIKG